MSEEGKCLWAVIENTHLKYTVQRHSYGNRESLVKRHGKLMVIKGNMLQKRNTPPSDFLLNPFCCFDDK